MSRELDLKEFKETTARRVIKVFMVHRVRSAKVRKALRVTRERLVVFKVIRATLASKVLKVHKAHRVMLGSKAVSVFRATKESKAVKVPKASVFKVCRAMRATKVCKAGRAQAFRVSKATKVMQDLLEDSAHRAFRAIRVGKA